MSKIKLYISKYYQQEWHLFLQPVLLSLLFVCLLIVLTADNSITVFKIFFLKPFQSKWYFGTMLNKFSLLLFSATGALFALKTKHLNLGGEGQIYIAGFITAILLRTHGTMPAAIQFFGVMLVAVFASGIAGFISAILKMKFKASELVTSFLISAVLLTLISAAISGPMRDTTENLLATASIDTAFVLPSLLLPSVLNASIIFALVITCLAFVFFNLTSWGYKLHIAGIAPEFTAASGFPLKHVSYVSLIVSATLHGLTGFFSIVGTWHLCHEGFHGGMGWAALAIALMAGDSFLALLPAALFYAWIESASQACVMSGDLRLNISLFFQAGLYLFVSAKHLSCKNFVKKFQHNTVMEKNQ